MTKYEFLKQLGAELERLPKAEQKRQLDYYAELLDDMVEDGMEPDMAVERLGPVSEIVHTIFQDTPQPSKGHRRRGFLLCMVCGAVALASAVGALVWVVGQGRNPDPAEVSHPGTVEVTVDASAEPTVQPHIVWEEISTFGFDGYWHWNNAPYASSGAYDVPATDVTSLDLRWLAGEVTVKPWKGEAFRFQETVTGQVDRAAPSVENALRYGVENHTLYIQYCAIGDYDDLPVKNLTVWVPMELAGAMRQLQTQMLSADLTVQEISAKRLELQSVSGAVDLQDVEAEEANFSSVSGDMAWDGVIQRTTMKTTSGNITVAAEEAPERMSLSAVSGDVVIYVPKQMRFGIIYHTTSGTMGGDYPLFGTPGGEKFYYGNSDLEYRVDTVSGDLTVNQNMNISETDHE